MSDLIKRLNVLREFLGGAGPLDGFWFGDANPDQRGAFWWRRNLSVMAEAADQLADAQAAQAMVVERAADMIEDNVRHAKGLGREIWAMPDLRALADADGLALVQALRDRAEKAEAELQRFHEDRAYVIGANDGWDAAVEQGEASPAAGKAMVRLWKRLAKLHLIRAEAVIADRDRLAAANAVLEAKVAGLVEALPPDYGHDGLRWKIGTAMRRSIDAAHPETDRDAALYHAFRAGVRAALATQEAGT